MTTNVTFNSKNDEYLLEIKDFESRKFLANNLTDTNIITEDMPAQFQETFEALQELEVFVQYPEINTKKSLQNNA